MRSLAFALPVLLLGACGGGATDDTVNGQVKFDTTGPTGARGRSEITAIDAALGDDAGMPAEAAMPSPVRRSSDDRAEPAENDAAAGAEVENAVSNAVSSALAPAPATQSGS